jgi:hypothetical protein
MNTIPTNNMTTKRHRFSVDLLITSGLGYCCSWFFFTHFKRTALIAIRLGVTPRAVRYAKAKFKSGEMKCRGCENCMCKKTT